MSSDNGLSYEADTSLPLPPGLPGRGNGNGNATVGSDGSIFVKLSRSSVKRRGKMATRTCEACRKAKVKCISEAGMNELVSTCQRCAARGLPCLWTETEAKKAKTAANDPLKASAGPSKDVVALSPAQSSHSAPISPPMQSSIQWRLNSRNVSNVICQSLLDQFVATVRTTPGLDWTYGHPDRLALDGAYLAAGQTFDALAPEMQGLAAIVLSISARLFRMPPFEDAFHLPLAPELRPTATGEVDQLVIRYIGQQAARPAVSLVTCATDALIVMNCMLSGSDYLFAKNSIRRLSLSAVDFVHSLQGRKPCELGEDVQRIMYAAWFADSVYSALIGTNPLLSLDDMQEMFPAEIAQHLAVLPPAPQIATDLANAAAHGGFPMEIYYMQYVTIGAGRACAEQLFSRSSRLRAFNVHVWRQHRNSLEALSKWCMSISAAFPELRDHLPFVQTLVPTTYDEPLDLEAIRTVHYCWTLIIGLELTVALEPLFRLYSTIDEQERAELTNIIAAATPSITRDIRYVAHILHVALKQHRQIACDPIFVFLRFQINAVVQHLCAVPADHEFSEEDRTNTIETLLAGLNHVGHVWAWAQPQCMRLNAELQARRPMPMPMFNLAG